MLACSLARFPLRRQRKKKVPRAALRPAAAIAPPPQPPGLGGAVGPSERPFRHDCPVSLDGAPPPGVPPPADGDSASVPAHACVLHLRLRPAAGTADVRRQDVRSSPTGTLLAPPLGRTGIPRARRRAAGRELLAGRTLLRAPDGPLGAREGARGMEAAERLPACEACAPAFRETASASSTRMCYVVDA